MVTPFGLGFDLALNQIVNRGGRESKQNSWDRKTPPRLGARRGSPDPAATLDRRLLFTLKCRSTLHRFAGGNPKANSPFSEEAMAKKLFGCVLRYIRPSSVCSRVAADVMVAPSKVDLHKDSH
jgi:hypothetical protein